MKAMVKKIKPKFTESCSIVIPVFQAEATIQELIHDLAKYLPAFFPKFEVICVVDGSTDNSWNIIVALGKKYKWLKGIKLMRNFGQQNATLCGVRMAKYELTVTMDDDLQHPVDQLPFLVNKLRDGFDVVYGCPQKPPAGLFRNLITNFTKQALIFVTQHSMPKDISAFMVFRTSLREAFKDFQSSDAMMDVLLSWGTSKFTSVKVEIKERKIGKSNYNLSKLIRTTLIILTGFSTIPLRVSSLIGFFMTLMGVMILIYVIAIYLTEGSIPGFTFLASIIAIFSGAQLFSLGMVGEYLARIFNRSMDRPVYVIEKSFGGLTQPK
jgi:glycosyltransferase involved in cell wall biosynthesis